MNLNAEPRKHQAQKFAETNGRCQKTKKPSIHEYQRATKPMEYLPGHTCYTISLEQQFYVCTACAQTGTMLASAFLCFSGGTTET